MLKLSLRKKPPVFTIIVTDTHVAVRGGDHDVALVWDAIGKGMAYKRDIYAVDLICIALEDSGRAMELNEEMVGWESFLAALPAKLPGCLNPDQIWKAVALPAFVTNATVIFERKRTEP
jgi:hypothetical protein